MTEYRFDWVDKYNRFCQPIITTEFKITGVAYPNGSVLPLPDVQPIKPYIR